MNASLLLADSVADQLQALNTLVRELRDEVGQLRAENAQLRQQVSELKCEVGYWKSRHADAVSRNLKLQAELELANAEIRQLKAERFGKQIVDVDESEILCDCCGKPLADLGYKEDGEQIEIETIVYRKLIRRKRLRRTCNCPDQPRTITATAPAKLLLRNSNTTPFGHYDAPILTRYPRIRGFLSLNAFSGFERVAASTRTVGTRFP